MRTSRSCAGMAFSPSLHTSAVDDGMHNTMKLESPTSLVAMHARKFATVREIITRLGNTSMNVDADRQTMLHCTRDG